MITQKGRAHGERSSYNYIEARLGNGGPALRGARSLERSAC